jgi:TolA-binding protein
MKQEFTNLDLMDRCLRREFDAAEQADFERRLRDDPAFAAEWDAFRDLVTAIEIEGEQELRKTIFQVQKKLETEQFFSTDQPRPTVMKNQSFFRKIMAAAAAIAAIAVAFYLYNLNQKEFTPEQFAQFAKPDKEQVVKILDRLEAPGFASPDKGREDSLASALKLYRDDDFEKARVELAQYCEKYPDDKIGKHYLGLTLFQQGEYAKAAAQLSPLTADASFELRNPAKWYLALCYTQFRNTQGFKDARALMQQLADDPNSGYATEAKEYIRQILKKS